MNIDGPTSANGAKRREPRRAAPVALALIPLALLQLGACQRGAPPAAAPALVVAVSVHASPDGGGAMRYPVEAAARYASVMAFRVPGKIIERRVRLGDAVRRGQVLARLDPADADQQVASALAVLTSAEHRLGFAKQQLDRDQAQAAANLIAATQREQTEDAYAAAESARSQAAAALALARDNRRYTVLRADHDGLITSENANTGEVIAAGQPVYGLAWSGDVDAELDAAASDLGRLAIGQSASVSFVALPGRLFDARVREIAPAADPLSRTYRVKLTLPRTGTDLRLGMNGEATLSAVVPNAAALSRSEAAADAARGGAEFRIPATAIFHQGGTPAVWSIRPDDSTLELRTVRIAGYGERDALVSAGLHDGERIVAAGVHTVFAGEKVQAAAPPFAGEETAAPTEAP